MEKIDFLFVDVDTSTNTRISPSQKTICKIVQNFLIFTNEAEIVYFFLSTIRLTYGDNFRHSLISIR